MGKACADTQISQHRNVRRTYTGGKLIPHYVIDLLRVPMQLPDEVADRLGAHVLGQHFSDVADPVENQKLKVDTRRVRFVNVVRQNIR